LGVSISAHNNEVVIGPHDNGFPGPAAALDGPDKSMQAYTNEKDENTLLEGTKREKSIKLNLIHIYKDFLELMQNKKFR